MNMGNVIFHILMEFYEHIQNVPLEIYSGCFRLEEILVYL